MREQQTGRIAMWLGLILVLARPAFAADATETGVVTTLTGQATLARATLPAPQALSLRDIVLLRDRISTRERSLVHVLMGGKALLTVGELSDLTIAEEGDRTLIDLQGGKIGLAVVRQRMRPGEVIEIRTPNAVAAVRGTVVVVEIVPGGADSPGGATGVTTNVHLIHGALDVSLRDDPARPPVQLQTLQSLGVTGKTFGAVQPLSPEAATAVTADLKPTQRPHNGPPSGLTQQLLSRQHEQATALAATLLGTTHKDGHAAKTQAASGILGSKEADKGADAVGGTVQNATNQVNGGAVGGESVMNVSLETRDTAGDEPENGALHLLKVVPPPLKPSTVDHDELMSRTIPVHHVKRKH